MRDLSFGNEEIVVVTRISYSPRWPSFEECQEIWKIRALRRWNFCPVEPSAVGFIALPVHCLMNCALLLEFKIFTHLIYINFR